MSLMRIAAGAVAVAAILGARPLVRAQAGSEKAGEKGHAPGIYLATRGDSGEQMVRIVGAQPHEVKNTGMAKMILSQGLLKGSTLVELGGPVADIRTSSTSPTFYFYFDTAAESQSADPLAALTQVMGGDAMPYGAKQAADFSLVHLTLTDGNRRANMGKIGSQGGKPKDSVDCVQERLDRGAYTLRPKKPLQPGEYAFFFVNSRPGMGGYTAWDFGVDAAK
jgi:hypothetical protein